MTRHLRSPACLLLCALSLLPAAADARADTWESPKTRKVPSANGRYTALVVPTDLRQDARPKVQVYEGEPGAEGRWETLWAVTLSNRVAPVEVFLSNDGEHLVTLDNWHRVGRGDDTVAFYERNEARGMQLARYALDQILSREELERVEMSVSSTWWRRHGYTFFEDPAAPGDPTLLCVWLDAGSRWAVWDVTEGKPVEVKPGGPLDRRLTARAKEVALGETRSAKPGRDVTGALRLLAHARDPRDRPEIERFLRTGDFPQFAQHGGGEPFVVEVESKTRREADRALVRHAGKPVAETGGWGRSYVAWRYVHLGTLEVPVTFDPPLARAPRHRAFVYLGPEDVPDDAWAASQLEHRAVLALQPLPQTQPQTLPQTRPHTRPTTVPASGAAALVRFRGVTPGRYWIKVVHDRAEPHHAGDPRRAVTPSPGDVQSAGRPLVEVKPGDEVRADEVRCVQRLPEEDQEP